MNLFSDSFIPHGHCYLWKPPLVGLHIFSDALTALAYYSIPAMLVYFVNKKEHLPFPWIFWMFSAFILSCGTTHLMEVWTLWHPTYWVSGAIKAITALISLITAVLLVWIIPKALSLPSPEELQQANQQLAQEMKEREIAQEALAKSEKRFRAIFNQAFQFIGLLATDGTVLEVNQTALEFSGLKHEDAIAKPFWQTPWWSAPRVEEKPIGFAKYARGAIEKALQGQVVRTEFQVPSVNGKLVTIDASFKPVIDEFGEVSLIIAEGRDITQHKRIEEELRQYKKHLELMVEERTFALTQANEQLQREMRDRFQVEVALGKSEARFQTLADNVPGMIYQFRLQPNGNMSFPFVSSGCRDIYELTPQQIQNNPLEIENRIYPSHRQSWRHSVMRSAQTLTRWQWEGRIVTPSGKCKWISASSRPEKQFNGDILWDGVVMDVTERKQAEAALRESQERLQLALDGTEQGLWDWSVTSGSVYYSPQWSRMLEYDVDEIEATMNARDRLIHPLDLPQVQQALQAHLEGETSVYEMEYRMQTKSGDWKWMLDRGKVCERDARGRGMRVIGIQRDISDRKAYEAALVEAREAALQSLSIRSQFLANMSHEIRTPMNGVLGMARLLLQSDLTPKQGDFARTIHSSAQHLLSVINDILDFSKLEAGEMELETLDFNLDTFMEEVVEILTAQAEMKGLELVVLVYSQVPRLLRGDPRRLRQILLNLVGNAIKFTDSGDVVVQVAWAGATDSTLRLRFSVTDTGVGISPEGQEKLFRSFSQVDASTTRQYGGTGLGLAICKQLVELMDGEIGVESEVGVGSTFWFTVEVQKQCDAMSPPMPLDLAGRRLLVAAEPRKTRQVVQYLAHSWGMHSDAVASGERALQAMRQAIARQQPYDVLLLDVQLASGEGEDSPIEMVRRHPQLGQTRLLLLTSLQQRDRVEELLGKGCCDYLLKPVKTSQLFEKLVAAVLADPAVADCSTTQLTREVAAVRSQVAFAKRNPEAIAQESETSRPPIDDAPASPRVSSSQKLELRILVAEDHPVNQQVILSQLEALGYQAECVANGEELLDRWSQEEWDLVLMDCQMPVKDGYQATRELRQREANSERHTAIVALTAHAMPAEREKCLAVGMDDYLSKPVELDDLSDVLERWIAPESQHSRRPAERETETAPPASPPTSHNGQVAQNPSDDTPLNLQRLHNLSRGKIALQKRLLQAFLDAADSDIDALGQAMESGNLEELGKLAHRLKGSAGNVGAETFSAIASQLEQWASHTHPQSTDSPDKAQGYFQELQHQLERLQAFVQTQLQS